MHEHLHPRRLASSTLPGKLELALAQGAAHHLISAAAEPRYPGACLRRYAGPAGSAGAAAAGLRRGQFEARDLILPAADVFVTAEQQKDSRRRLVCRSPDFTVRWEKTFGPTPNATLTASAADSTHLWLVLMTDYQTRHPAQHRRMPRLGHWPGTGPGGPHQ